MVQHRTGGIPFQNLCRHGSSLHSCITKPQWINWGWMSLQATLSYVNIDLPVGCWLLGAYPLFLTNAEELQIRNIPLWNLNKNAVFHCGRVLKIKIESIKINHDASKLANASCVYQSSIYKLFDRRKVNSRWSHVSCATVAQQIWQSHVNCKMARQLIRWWHDRNHRCPLLAQHFSRARNFKLKN